MLSQMIQDFDEANDAGKKDMFEEAAERMITAEKALKAKDATIAALETRLAEAEAIIEGLRDIPAQRLYDIKLLKQDAKVYLKKYPKD